MNVFTTARNVYTYDAFLEYAAEQVAHNEAHPETVKDEKYAFYTKLNLQRMKRWNKTFSPDEELVAALRQPAPQEWWVITEAWCGDSAQNLPVIAALTAAAGVRLNIVLRDENEEIMNAYLTNGTKSIPILAAFNEAGEQLFRWGPRPQGAQELMTAWKADPAGRDFETFELEMHQWYTRDKGKATQKELAALL